VRDAVWGKRWAVCGKQFANIFFNKIRISNI
jgi:hypothetical protein